MHEIVLIGELLAIASIVMCLAFVVVSFSLRLQPESGHVLVKADRLVRTAGEWFEGARPRTLPAAIAPVASIAGPLKRIRMRASVAVGRTCRASSSSAKVRRACAGMRSDAGAGHRAQHPGTPLARQLVAGLRGATKSRSSRFRRASACGSMARPK